MSTYLNKHVQEFEFRHFALHFARMYPHAGGDDVKEIDQRRRIVASLGYVYGQDSEAGPGEKRRHSQNQVVNHTGNLLEQNFPFRNGFAR